ncbi:Bicupin oxalate decarboxylase oxidase [Guyanagaster necrorhizus]|uniref:Bicupin oxalate decarboxylase oxidase n=1 Tax=Guyanagaster necrorhizus TaxID=856835 RepID=A0A9P8ANQ3_9AGAR|nr:Bicupin oxalate decarboxylase oxidase [Guyanagaster necrorhizus MCA 3950]KAG7442548.1 Bicupin oxalate decarboxylase oxidase [Guyanagaster necrorhizus MCA 3950]
MSKVASFLWILLLAKIVASAPAPVDMSVSDATAATPSTSGTTIASNTDSALEATATVEFISTDPNGVLWNEESNPSIVTAERGKLGASVIGPDNIPTDLQNPDFLAPPTTDSGTVSNAKWPFALSHNRLQTGGWARQENIGVMPIATEMAGVNMRLEAGAIRELHWHKTAEWAYVLKGSTQITAVDTEGRNYLATVGPGDLWYFPAGIPHSLQATGDDEEGSEFLLVFDDGDFSEDSTFLLTDWLSHVPYEVIQKNFQIDNSDAFAHIPKEELYIFPSTVPEDDASAPESPQGTVPNPYSFALSKANATQSSGGSVKIVDSTSFTVSTTIAVAEVTVEPGAMRELHWHPTMDEWSFFIEGTARVTIFASQGTARTFNYQPGDIGYVPAAYGHYVENTGNTTMKFLEIFKSDRFEDISLNQWLALTPPAIVKAHLNIDDATISQLSKVKPVVIGPGA